MKKVLNVVIDTNIFLSALLGSKTCRKILDAFLEEKFDICISSELLDEFIETTGKEKFKDFITLVEIKKLVSLLKTDINLVISLEKVSICRDPKDNIVLECGVAGKVDFIVTGDKDLLSLKTFRSIRILTPKQFITRLMRK